MGKDTQEMSDLKVTTATNGEASGAAAAKTSAADIAKVLQKIKMV